MRFDVSFSPKVWLGHPTITRWNTNIFCSGVSYPNFFLSQPEWSTWKFGFALFCAFDASFFCPFFPDIKINKIELNEKLIRGVPRKDTFIISCLFLFAAVICCLLLTNSHVSLSLVIPVSLIGKQMDMHVLKACLGTLYVYL